MSGRKLAPSLTWLQPVCATNKEEGSGAHGVGWEGEAHGFPVESSLVVTLEKRPGLTRSVRVNGGGVQVLITSHSSRWLGFFAPFNFFLLYFC